MLDPINRDVETGIQSLIDVDEMDAHLDVFDNLARVSGTEDEWEASEYVVEKLEAYGVDAEILEFEALISTPEEAGITVTSPEKRNIDEAITTSFGASTPPSGVDGEVVHVPELTEESLAAEDVEGKLVFTRGLPTPEPITNLEAAGAAGVVFESLGGEHLHEMIVTPIWGTPSHEDADQIPDLPVVEVTSADGEWLREKVTEGPVEATIRTQVTIGLTTLPCPVGRIEGTKSDRYMLMGNHVDSWYEGVTDNATAMATTMEVARVIAEADEDPHRGLVFGFWPAHSTGRYAGSAWYADEEWLDLNENGVCYLHVDLNGLKGADSIWFQHMAELADEHLDAIESATDLPLRDDDESWLGSSGRPARNSDQSFWGAGLSSLLSGARLDPATDEGGPIGGGWWWHTPEDTRDKVDMDVLVEETQLYVALAARFGYSPVLPHDYTATVKDIRTVLSDIESFAGQEFEEIHSILNELEAVIIDANELINNHAESDPNLAADAEDLQVQLGNLLVPTLYMETEEYGHDPALPHQRLPYLRLAEELPELSGRERRFAETSVRRGRNRVVHRVGKAVKAARRFVDKYA
ncbi:M28 family peptidase [Halalkalirubrum salinum]|uniref:M28 family peptidase n=1 Tax=Halalkalirubrum salinum TaxID=2563889 RepID=UPI0010FB4D01|nr:M28 family peptidase [Halalkalirubrum salinum]